MKTNKEGQNTDLNIQKRGDYQDTGGLIRVEQTIIQAGKPETRSEAHRDA